MQADNGVGDFHISDGSKASVRTDPNSRIAVLASVTNQQWPENFIPYLPNVVVVHPNTCT